MVLLSVRSMAVVEKQGGGLSAFVSHLSAESATGSSEANLEA